MDWFRPELCILGGLVIVLATGFVSEFVRAAKRKKRRMAADLENWKNRAITAETELSTVLARDEASRCHWALIREQEAERWKERFEAAERKRAEDVKAWEARCLRAEEIANKLWPGNTK